MRVIIGLKLVGLNRFILSKELFGPLEAATWKFLYFLFIWAKSRRVRISCLQRHNSLMPKQLCSFSSVTIYRSVSFPSLLIRASISAVRNMFACIYIYPKKMWTHNAIYRHHDLRLYWFGRLLVQPSDMMRTEKVLCLEYHGLPVPCASPVAATGLRGSLTIEF